MRADKRQMMTPAEIAKEERSIARAVRSGVPKKQVAKRFRIDHREVTRICEKMGVVPPMPRSRNWL